MSILNRLSFKSEWEAFYKYKIDSGNLNKKDADALHAFIDNCEYLEIAQKIQNGGGFSAPKKALINKHKAGKKRTVFTFNNDENYLLKLITFMLKKYDGIFAPNLYSFRKNKGVKAAVNALLKTPDINNRYVYKVDISDYFNSVDVSLLLPELETVLADDPLLYNFIKELLNNPFALFDGVLTQTRKGIMAGVPISTFLANLYLKELDFFFYQNQIPYMRYSDDIIVFAKDTDQLDFCVKKIKDFLAAKKLQINPEKESLSLPQTEWTFLGFSYNCGVIDISPVSFKKLKAKMRRKTRALSRWAKRKGVSGERAAKAFIRHFNAKLFNNPVMGELTWTKWFFPIINTDSTLKKIDLYMQDCIRILATGKNTKSKYHFRYKDIKLLGYKNLVNEYYRQITNP